MHGQKIYAVTAGRIDTEVKLMPTVTVVVPAFNEEKTITDTIRALKQRPEVNNILVVND
ncbi:MAG TPA: hypothetical protein DD811_05595, partial [Syntrophomonas sp.]|nr:hypothetical protein [Syntrophomonas sp.]